MNLRSDYAAAMVLGALLLAAAIDPLGGAPPWLRDAFVPRRVAVTEAATSIELLGDAVGDLVVRAEGVGVVVELAQLGSAVRVSDAAATAAPTAAYAAFAALSDEEWLPFNFELGANGRPRPLLTSVKLAMGDSALVRTLRASEGGGGAVARLRVAPRAAATAPVTLELEVLALDPALSRLPRASDDYEQALLGARAGRTLLFPSATTHHPAWCSFDVLHADRDHLEWSAQRGRELVHVAALDLRLASGEVAPGRVGARGLGGERWLQARLFPDAAASDALAPAWLEWSDLAADALAPDEVGAYPLVVLDRSFEAAPHAFVVALDGARTAGLAPSLFSVESDEQGKVALPVERRADLAAIEVIAFQAGARARFGRRLGVRASVGGETVLLLDQAATTHVAVMPPPRFRTWVGLDLASGHFRLPLAADGTLALPALGGVAQLHLAEPYVEQSLEVRLDAAARVEVHATRAPPR